MVRKPPDSLAHQRSLLAINEVIKGTGLQALPGKRWGYVSEKSSSRPTGIIYDEGDIEKIGLQRVQNRLTVFGRKVECFDSEGGAQFSQEMDGRGLERSQIQEVYQRLTSCRQRAQLLADEEIKGIKEELIHITDEETNRLVAEIPFLSPIEKVLALLELGQTDYLFSGMTTQKNIGLVFDDMSAEDVHLMMQMQEDFQAFSLEGDQAAYKRLVDFISSQYREVPNQDISPAPEAKDEYAPLPPSPETGTDTVFFEVTPPSDGYYKRAVRNRYDRQSKKWQTESTEEIPCPIVEGDDPHTAMGKAPKGKIHLPVLDGYSVSGSDEITQDRNGNYFLHSDNEHDFSYQFAKERAQAGIQQPTAIETESMYAGSLSEKTESFLQQLRTERNPMTVAEKLRQYIQEAHRYPEGNGKSAALDLQYRLFNESTAENYIQNLDASEELECYSANTLFAALLRGLEVPTRLVEGFLVDDSQKDKTVLSAKKSHAWIEVWNGKSWVRFDATPPSGDQFCNQPCAGDVESGEARSKLQQAENSVQNATQIGEKVQKELGKPEISFADLDKLSDVVQKAALPNDVAGELNKEIRKKEQGMKDAEKQRLDDMVNDGFLDEAKADELKAKMDKVHGADLDQLDNKTIDEDRLYDEYLQIVAEVLPSVDAWYSTFTSALPMAEDAWEVDDNHTHRGTRIDMRAALKPNNFMSGNVFSTESRVETTKPQLFVHFLVDVSGSMADPVSTASGMNQTKIRLAQKMFVFYSELMSRVRKEYGYINTTMSVFSDSVRTVKGADQLYDSPDRYKYGTGEQMTVKARIMQALTAHGGTNMYDAFESIIAKINETMERYPDYGHSFMLIGDGMDTQGNERKIRSQWSQWDDRFDADRCMRHALLLGEQKNEAQLKQIFGDDYANVGDDFDSLVDASMEKIILDVKGYYRT